MIAVVIAPPLSLLLFLIPLIGWYRSPVGILQWDGAAWSWNGIPVPRVTVQLDWQYGMVVSATASVWLDAPSVELRRALYDRSQHCARSQ